MSARDLAPQDRESRKSLLMRELHGWPKREAFQALLGELGMADACTLFGPEASDALRSAPRGECLAVGDEGWSLENVRAEIDRLVPPTDDRVRLLLNFVPGGPAEVVEAPRDLVMANLERLIAWDPDGIAIHRASGAGGIDVDAAEDGSYSVYIVEPAGTDVTETHVHQVGRWDPRAWGSSGRDRRRGPVVDAELAAALHAASPSVEVLTGADALPWIEGFRDWFVLDVDRTWWWERLRVTPRQLPYAGTEAGLELLAATVGDWGRCCLIATDEEPSPGIVAIGAVRELLDAVRGTRFFEFVLVDEAMTRFVFDTHANVLLVHDGPAAARSYRYVGPDEIRTAVASARTGTVVHTPNEARDWLRQSGESEAVTATFVVDLDGNLVLAPRESEHVAAAHGLPVLAAGEMTLRAAADVVEVTNQSTGYCPEPASWTAVATALDRAGLARPAGFTTVFTFRRCEGCGSINLVKDGWLVCAVCDAPLPADWNFG